jgi:hypothetical protein
VAGSNPTRHGTFLRGEFLGRIEQDTYTPRGSSEVRTVKPKIGVRVDGEEIEVRCKDNDQMNHLARGWVKGDVVEVPVELRPSFGAPRGTTVDFFAPGAFEAAGKREWR